MNIYFYQDKKNKYQGVFTKTSRQKIKLSRQKNILSRQNLFLSRQIWQNSIKKPLKLSLQRLCILKLSCYNALYVYFYWCRKFTQYVYALYTKIEPTRHFLHDGNLNRVQFVCIYQTDRV